MGFDTLDDIERKREEREREEFKKTIVKDIRDVFGGVFPQPLRKKEVKKKNNFLRGLKWLGILFLLLIIVNFILGNIWLLKTLIKSLFLGG